MIYVCRSCNAACAWIGWACESICLTVRAVCAALRDACGRVFGCAVSCACLCSPCRRPLGGLILLSLLTCLPIVTLCARALFHLDAKPVQDCDRVATAARVSLVLGAAHVLFAFYAQRQLLARSPGEADDDVEGASSVKGPLSKRAWDLLLHDFVVCLYIPMAAFSFVFGFVSMGWCFACSQDSHGALAASVLLVLYGLISSAYFMFWLCTISLCGFIWGETTATPSIGSNSGVDGFYGSVAFPSGAAVGASATGPIQGMPAR